MTLSPPLSLPSSASHLVPKEHWPGAGGHDGWPVTVLPDTLSRVLDAEWCKEEHCWAMASVPEHKHTDAGVLSRAFVMGVRFAAEQLGAISDAE